MRGWLDYECFAFIQDQAFAWLEKACEERFNRLAYVKYVKVEALWDHFSPLGKKKVWLQNSLPGGTPY
jgi:hypothetical protein